MELESLKLLTTPTPAKKSRLRLHGPCIDSKNIQFFKRLKII